MDKINKKDIKIHKRKKLSKEERHKIFERDNYECQLCRPKKNLLYLPLKRRIDHKIPLSKGGTNDYENLWLVCDDCDKAKKNKLFKRFKKKDKEIKLKQITHRSLVNVDGNNSSKNV
jgi:5-methylcytosine-specific restriction endonuclease McrA